MTKQAEYTHDLLVSYTTADRSWAEGYLVDAFGEWTESRTEVGIFSVLAEATVRPRGRAGRTKARETRRSNRRTTREAA